MNRKIGLVSAATLLSIWLGVELTGGASAAEPKAAVPKTPAAPAPAKAAAPAKPLNAIATAAASQGVKSCLGRIDQVTDFLSKGATVGAFLFNAPESADKKIYSTSMEIKISDTLAYATTTFAPVGTAGCGAAYDAVTYWPVDCAQTAKTTFSNMKPVGLVKNSIQILEGGPAVRVFLMPAGQGCVAIKKEVVF
jgi:hypothetical protein